jgi:Bifunctional DNA primase/polymerase, N-terminal
MTRFGAKEKCCVKKQRQACALSQERAGVAIDLRGAAVNASDCNREVALTFVRAGFHVFPCDSSTEKPRSKRPLVENWPNRATNAENGVRHYWATRPGAIVGLPLGKAGLVVIDLDLGHADGQDGTAEFGKILDYYGGTVDGVPIVRTWRGGYHLYYRQPMGRDPLGNREGMLTGCGINVRGAGGYVIAPGSVMATGEYYDGVPEYPDLCETFVAGTIPEIPGWLVELIEWRDDRVPSSPAPVFTDATPIGSGNGRLARCATRRRRWRWSARATATMRLTTPCSPWPASRGAGSPSMKFIRPWPGPAPSTS